MQNQFIGSHKPLKKKRKEKTFPLPNILYHYIYEYQLTEEMAWLAEQQSTGYCPQSWHRGQKTFFILLFHPFEAFIWAQAFLWFLTSAQTLWKAQSQLKYQGD